MESPLKKGIGEVVTEYGARVMKIFKRGLLGSSLFEFYGEIRANKYHIKNSFNSTKTPLEKRGGLIFVKKSDGKLYYKSSRVSEVAISDTSEAGSTLAVQDVDGTPNISNVTRLKVTNGTLTDNGSGVVTLNTGGASSLDALSDVDVSTSSPQTNQVLMFNGANFVAADEGSVFTFVWNSVAYNNNTDDKTDTSPSSDLTSTKLIGSGNHITSSLVTLSFQNAVSSKFTSGINGSDNLGLSTQAWNEGSMTGRANLSFDQSNQRATASTGDISLPFPSSLASNYYSTIKVRFQYDSNNNDHQLKFLYKNYMYLGKHTDDSPTNSELQNFQKKAFINNGSSNTTDISAFGISLNSTSQHLQFWYPSRINTTPSFNVGASAAAVSGEDWTAISGTVSHENSVGFTETYKGWRSPNPLDNSGGTTTWYVQVIF